MLNPENSVATLSNQEVNELIAILFTHPEQELITPELRQHLYVLQQETKVGENLVTLRETQET